MAEPLLDSAFLERLERLTLQWNRSFPGLIGGHNPSRFSGPGQEFLDHRIFHRGDDLRAVNWRAYMRLDKLFLKMFQVEPRVPVRLLLDTSDSMTVGSSPGSPSKFHLASRLAAALCYIGLVRLDTMTLQPFAGHLLDPFLCGGGRHRFQPAERFLRDLKPVRNTSFFASVRQFIEQYPQRGLLIVISDFLDDSDVLRPLQYLADFGHELILVQLWGELDRMPSDSGEVELEDAETGTVLTLGVDDATRKLHAEAFDRYSEQLQSLALRNNGRYTSISTSVSLEEALFDSLIRSKGIA